MCFQSCFVFVCCRTDFVDRKQSIESERSRSSSPLSSPFQSFRNRRILRRLADKLFNYLVCLAKLSGLFYKVRNYINKSTFCMLYYNFVYTRLQYGIIIWKIARKTKLKLFKISQNKILRIILSSNTYTSVSKFIKR